MNLALKFMRLNVSWRDYSKWKYSWKRNIQQSFKEMLINFRIISIEIYNVFLQSLKEILSLIQKLFNFNIISTEMYIVFMKTLKEIWSLTYFRILSIEMYNVFQQSLKEILFLILKLFNFRIISIEMYHICLQY